MAYQVSLRFGGSLPGIQCLFHRLVIRIQFRFHKQNGSDATSDVGDLAGLVDSQRPAQQVAFAIAQPFLDDLVTANGVLPYLRAGTFFQ